MVEIFLLNEVGQYVNITYSIQQLDSMDHQFT
jgi:hypothetical protein